MDTIILIIANPWLLLVAVIFNAFAINGIWNAAKDKPFDSGRYPILHPVHMVTKRILGCYWNMPVLGCYKCMASLWAGFPALLVLSFAGSYSSPIYLPAWFVFAALYAGAVSFTSTVSMALLDALND